MHKKITLVSMDLLNFKGIREQHIDFGQVTNVYGDNGAGKTTLFDAFFWLLFDKNSVNDSKFEIKTLDDNGDPLHHLEHTVSATLEINGSKMTLSKTLKEKWVQKRGQAEQEFSGHETAYEINGVPLAMSAYKEQIKNIIDEKAFMLLTNPLQFSLATSWKDRREVLLKILGEISNEEVIKADPGLKALSSYLKGHTLEELQKITNATKRKLNDDLKIIPERIKEAQLSKIDPIPIKDLKREKKVLEDRTVDIEQGLKLRTGVDERKAALKRKIYELEGELLTVQRNASEGHQEAVRGLQKKWLDMSIDLGNLKQDLSVKLNDLDRVEKRLTIVQMDLAEKLAKYKDFYEQVFEPVEDETTCPTCQRPFDDDHIAQSIERQRERFNLTRSNLLTKTKNEGAELRKQEADLKMRFEELSQETQEIRNALGIAEAATEAAKKEYETKKSIDQPIPEKAMQIQDEIHKIQKELEAVTDDGSTQHLIEELEKVKSKIRMIDADLAKEGVNERAELRIAELESELSRKTEEYGSAERVEYLIEIFIQTKVKLLESRINDRFTNVRFKMFERQINGGLAETCEALVNTNGSLVPFKDANHAGKINAGLDIINTLTEYYSVVAPIWIDERGEVNKIIDTKGQLVNLYVSKDKSLRIEKEN